MGGTKDPAAVELSNRHDDDEDDEAKQEIVLQTDTKENESGESLLELPSGPKARRVSIRFSENIEVIPPLPTTAENETQLNDSEKQLTEKNDDASDSSAEEND